MALPRRLVLLVVTLAVARAVLAAAAPLTVDEAYYVQWALHPALGYLDHPPLVAWLTAAGLALGRTALAVRLPALALQAVTTLLAADLARALALGAPPPRGAGLGRGLVPGPPPPRGAGLGRGPAADRVAWSAALLLQAAPVFSLGGMLATPDAPLAFAWVGTLWALERALSRDPRWLVAAGGFLGIAGLSKLTAGALAVAALAGLARTAAGRALLRTRWPWVGAAVAGAVAAPVLAWNATHGWASVVFQAGHGLSGRTFSAARLAVSLGGQAAYVSPVLLVACLAPAVAALRRPAPALRVVAATALPVVVLFTAGAALTPGALPHWPAPGWLSAVLLLAVAGAPLLRPAVLSGAGLQLLALLLALAPSSLARDPRDEVRGWREGAAAAEVAAAGRTLAVGHWIALGQLGWFARGPVVYVGERPCAATYYARDPREEGRPLLVVTVDGLGPDRAALERGMGPLREAGAYEARDGDRIIRRYRFWRWDGGRGGAAAAAAR